MLERGAGPAAWTRWAGDAGRPWTVGIEEELMLLDPAGHGYVNRVDDVLEALPPAVAEHTAPETHACVLELRSSPHATVAQAAVELGGLRERVDDVLREQLGLCAAVAGLHPTAGRDDAELSTHPRYREVAASTRALARREPTMAQHVHVSVPDEDMAVRALDGLRGDLPVILALSANSPYWLGRDSGFASMRTPIFSMFPRVGIPRRFGGYGEYVATVGALLRSHAVADPGFVWWDARLQPRLGTVEVRVMDAQSRLLDVAALAAVVQCTVRRHAERRGGYAPAPELLAENRFLAARDGMDAQLLDERRDDGRRSLRAALAQLLEDSAGAAAELGCTAELEDAAVLAADPGYARQRRCADRHGMPGLLARLAGEFSHPARARVSAWAG
jgi:glutamate---cysteine ligase / carboxylate-amine ligase